MSGLTVWPTQNGLAEPKTKVVGKKRDIAFHSLRVALIKYAGRAGFPEQQAAWLVDHEEGKGPTMSGQLYFKGYNIPKMQEIIETVHDVSCSGHIECDYNI